jgi:PAS domain S-box-containing protein
MLYCNDKPSSTNITYNLLVVEDSELLNKIICSTLEKLNYQVSKAFTLKEATQKLEENTFDFIILDLNLPDSFGEDLLIEIKSLSKAKIIVLTSEVDKQIRETLFQMGIIDYLIKDENFKNSIKSIDDIIKSIEYNTFNQILVIDDSEFVCKKIENILNIRNYKTLKALSVKDGMELLDCHNVNLIILDMELPDIHGLDLLRKIKSDKKYSHIPVIVLSGHNSPELLRNALKSGAFDFINKPFNIEEFTLKVNIAIEYNRKYIEVVCHKKILNEYKEVVDESSIVSKTDPKGIITFVNDNFCKISGYTREELIGKSHNIIRHPDMPKSAFKDIWETIANKKVWHGKVKNLKKDGSFYIVQTTISPIVDYNDNIIEYIALRTDITDIEIIKENLKNTLEIENKNFKEAYKLSQEYNKAINDSSIVSRTDTNGVITYANDRFCKTSGYTKEELIGKTHNILRDPKAPDSFFKNMWDTITQGKTWKGQHRNRKKDGSYYYLENTIIPILNHENKIVEYVSIRHDITKIITIHKELENNQKEIIYKMGEIGESRSQETGNHVKRVALYSKLLAQFCGLPEKQSNLIFIASPMHDIGKVAIPDYVLNKHGKLDEKEWEIMMTHSQIGYDILKNSKRSILKAAAIVAHQHHEKWDGSGYPNGLKGKEIHLFGRITAVADVFDALGSDRVYKKAWDLDKIIDFMQSQKGKHFDPKLIDIFLKNLDKFLEIKDKLKD